jgi:hypothetical protein
MEIDELISGIIIKKIGKILSETPVKSAEILNPFSLRSFSFFNLTLLDSFNRTLAESFNSR